MYFFLNGGAAVNRWVGNLSKLIPALFLLAVAGLAGAQLPQTLSFPGPPGATVQITNINYDAGVVPTGALRGSGDLTFDLGGGNKFVGAATPFTGIFADANGVVALDKTGYTFTKDITWDNAFGSSVSAKIKSGFTILAKSTGAIVLTADAECTLPFKDENGVQSVLQCKQSTLVLNTSGFVFDTHAGVTNAPKVSACGFGITMTAPELILQAPAKPTMTLKAQNVGISTPIPSLLSDGDLALSATNFSITETGLPNFDNLSLGSAASIDPMAETALTATRIPLLTPANFGFELVDIGGSVKDGKLSLSKLDGNLVFPEDITDADSKGEAKIAITYNLGTKSFKASALKPINLSWQPVASGPTLKLALRKFTLDVAKGLSDLDATLTVTGDGALGDLSVEASGAVFDGNGISGKFTVKPTGLDIDGVHCTSGSISLDRDEVVGGAFVGSVNVTTMGNVGVAFGVSTTGVNISVQASKGLDWPGFGKLNITQGGGSVDANKKITFSISGDLTLTVLPDIDLAFNDLQFDTTGKITVAELALIKPVEIPIGPLTLHADKMAYSLAPSAFTIDGDVKFPDSLPVTGQVGFKGLTIPANGPISIGGISFVAKVAGVASITGEMETGGKYPDLGFTNLMDFKAGLALDCLSGVGLEGSLMMADNGVWVVNANVDIPAPGILLPPAPAFGPVLGIYGAGISVGHNVKLLPGVPKSGAPWFAIYGMQPDNWLVAGSVDICTPDTFVAWGRLTLALTLPQFSVSLAGKVALMTPVGNPDTDIPDDRRGDLVLGWFGNEFDIDGQLNFQFPPGLPLMSMTGKFDAKFSPQVGYIHGGWPIDQNGFSNTVGVPGVLAHTSKVGFNANFYPPPLSFEAALEESVNILIVEGHRSVDLGFSLGWEDSSVHVGVGIGGSIDFIVAKLSASASVTGDMHFQHFVPVHAGLGADFAASLSTFLGDITVHAHADKVIGW